MTQTSIIGFPRLGENRELKFATEKYFRNEISEEELFRIGKEIRRKHFTLVKKAGIDSTLCAPWVPSAHPAVMVGDFRNE